MKFQTNPNKFFYVGLNTTATDGDEIFGLSIGRLYLGYYADGCSTVPAGFCFGILNQYGCLD